MIYPHLRWGYIFQSKNTPIKFADDSINRICFRKCASIGNQSDEKDRAICQDHNGPQLEEMEHEYYKDLRAAKAEYNSPDEVQLECNNVPSLRDLTISKLKQNPEVLKDSSDYTQMEDHFDEHKRRTSEK